MVELLPLPEDDVDLERLVARFARAYLHDPHAEPFGRRGQLQCGIDVLATDRRGVSGDIWTFQAKNTKTFRPGDLTKLMRELDRYDGRVDTYVVVTTAPRDVAVQKLAQRLSEGRGHVVAVWWWDHFSENVIASCGSGTWLAAPERRRLRAEWLEQVTAAAETRPSLAPVSAILKHRVPVESVWVEPVTEIAEHGGASATFTPNRLDWFASGDLPRTVLIGGNAGSGKTSLLWHVVKERALRAADDPDAPLPVLIDAKEVAEHGADALRCALSLELPGPLWNEPLVDWIVAVDGLDEVGATAWDRTLREIRRLAGHPRIVGLVVGCRDSYLSLNDLDRAPLVRVAPWSAGKTREFQQKWRAASPAWTGATAAEGGAPAHALEVVLATMQDLGPSEPASMWFARMGLLDTVLGEWPGVRKGALPVPPRELLENLALAAARSGERFVTRDQRVEMGLADDEWSLGNDASRLGIYRMEGAKLVFSHRMVTESLAACALARETPTAIARAAEENSTAEVALLAALGKCVATPTAIPDLAAALFEPSGAQRAKAVRRLGTLVRVADEFGEKTGPIFDRVAQFVVSAASDERSPANRRTGAGWLGAVCESGGSLWAAVWRLLEPLLDADQLRAVSFRSRLRSLEAAGQAGPDLEFWAGCLDESDPAVRAVSVENIARQPESADRDQLLMLALLDHEGASFSTSPAMVAGTALHDSDVNRTGLAAFLRDVVNSGRQLPAAGAAIALRVGEVPAGELLRAVRDGWMQEHHPALYARLDELRDTQDGLAWLDQHWPSAPVVTPIMHAEPSFGTFTGILAPSVRVRGELLAAVVPAFVEPSKWAAAPHRVRMDPKFLEAVCVFAAHRPTSAGPVLEAALREFSNRNAAPFFPPEAQAALGAAAETYAPLATALVEWWDSGRVTMPSSFPGLALEGLAARGNRDAARVYAAWLPETPFMLVLAAYWRPPSQAVLAVPVVRAAARAFASSIWQYSTSGRLGKAGTLEHLHPSAAGHALRGLWPVWEGTEVATGLVTQAVTEQDRWFQAAVEAFLPTGAATPLHEALLARVTQWRDEPWYKLDFIVKAVVESQLTSQAVAALLEILHDGDQPASWVAASALADHGTDQECEAVSAAAAELFPRHFLGARLDDDAVRRIVRTAPRKWIERVEIVARQHQFWVAAEVLAILNGLASVRDKPVRTRVLALCGEISNWPQPWVPSRGFGVLRAANVADVLAAMIQADDEPVVTWHE